MLPVKLLKEWRLSGLDETVCYDLEFRAHGAVPAPRAHLHPLLVENSADHDSVPPSQAANDTRLYSAPSYP